MNSLRWSLAKHVRGRWLSYRRWNVGSLGEEKLHGGIQRRHRLTADDATEIAHRVLSPEGTGANGEELARSSWLQKSQEGGGV